MNKEPRKGGVFSESEGIWWGITTKDTCRKTHKNQHTEREVSGVVMTDGVVSKCFPH